MIDPTSPTWRAIAAWAAEQRAQHLEALARRGTDAATTEFLRGRIAQIDDLIGLDARPGPNLRVRASDVRA